MTRRTFIPLAAFLALACADTPTAPTLLEPDAANLTRLGDPPPPWALIEGEVTTDGSGEILAGASFSRSGDGSAPIATSHGGDAATYRAWLLITPGNQAALLRFTEGGTATFSKGAMISNVKGKVSGRGTMTVGGHTYQLSAVTEFEANRGCTTAPWNTEGPSCASFSAGDGSFSSQASVWTGILSNDGGGGNFDFPPGWNDGCKRFDCVCINCVVITDPNVTGR